MTVHLKRMRKVPNIQIPQTLFMELVRYHCLGIQDDDQMNQRIAEQLEQKVQKACNRLEYSKKLAERSEGHV